MPEEQQEKRGIVAAVDSTDWSRYAGQASEVRLRGQRRRRRMQAGAGLGTTMAVVGAVFAVNAFGPGPVTRQGAAPAATTGTTSAPRTPTSPTSETSRASTPVSDYPIYPATMPTKPLLVADGAKVLRSGVMGAGSIAGHQWEFAYRVIPSGSAANSQPQVNTVDITFDGKTVPTSWSEGATIAAEGYVVMDQEIAMRGVANPLPVGYGALSPSAISADLRWANGTVVQLPVTTIDGNRFTTFGWDPANPPEALEQVNPGGVQKIPITHDPSGSWFADPRKKTAVTPATTPKPTTPSGPVNLSQTPHVTPISSGLLGSGTIAGHTWQVAWEVIPSGSADNGSNEVVCTDTTVDGTTHQDGCTSGQPPGISQFAFRFLDGPELDLFPVTHGIVDPGTTAIGLQWADGTTSTTPTFQVKDWPMAALAFDSANPPKYLVEFGSYGEYRIPLEGGMSYTWNFNW